MTFLQRLSGAYKLYRFAVSDKRTPMAAKILPWAALIYLISPIDLVPDIIPLLGQLDDVLIVPLLIAIALGLIPRDVKKDAKKYEKGIIDIEPKGR